MQPAAKHCYPMRQLHHLLIVVTISVTGVYAQNTGPRQQQEQATEQKLEQVRAEIARESTERSRVESQYGDVQAEMREIDLAIGEIVRRIVEIEAEIVSGEQQLAILSEQRRKLEMQLREQREKLGALLRAAYMTGRDQQLRAWLARDRIADSARLTAYARYLQTHRLTQMRSLLTDLDELIKLTETITAAKSTLSLRQEQSQVEVNALAAKKLERKALMDKLDASLQTHDERIKLFMHDEKSLLSLLAKLRDVFSEISPQFRDALPITKLRGQLPRPVAGKVIRTFGTNTGIGRTADGILIATDVGAEIRAIAHGRVAYADWLQGFGLLIIVDHGEGFMSLYAQNEALLRDVGDWVQSGTALARAGASGGATQPALYFELRKNGQPLNPSLWLQK